MMDVYDSFLKMGSALVIVMALLMLAAAVARRWLVPSLAGGGARHPIRLAGSLALGGRRTILVLEVRDRTLVVGATAQNLVLLTQFADSSLESVPVPVPREGHSRNLDEALPISSLPFGFRWVTKRGGPSEEKNKRSPAWRDRLALMPRSLFGKQENR
jgi:flagellar biogenesis protein FliO